MMTVEASKIVKFDVKNDEEDHGKYGIIPLISVTVSDDELLELIIKQLPPNYRIIAENQIRIYIEKITSHPGMRSEYIKKIKQLIIYEKNFNKKRVD